MILRTRISKGHCGAGNKVTKRCKLLSGVKRMHKHINDGQDLIQNLNQGVSIMGHGHINRLAACLSRKSDTVRKGGVALHINFPCHLVMVSHEYDPECNQSRKDILTAVVVPWAMAPSFQFSHLRTIKYQKVHHLAPFGTTPVPKRFFS
jgi:hypothetical protein